MTSVLNGLFPQARAELLRLLFGQPGARLHVRELTRQSGLSLGTIQAELRKLTGVGLLASAQDGNRLYYSANSAHPIFPELRSLILKTSGLKDVLWEALSSVEGVEHAFVFGSTATGEAGPESDVDLMVLGTATLRSLAPPLRHASATLQREINPHTLTFAEWHRRLRAQDAFILRVSKEPKIWMKGEPSELGDVG
jgi:predicted nucleotidyltransferase